MSEGQNTVVSKIFGHVVKQKREGLVRRVIFLLTDICCSDTMRVSWACHADCKKVWVVYVYGKSLFGKNVFVNVLF